MAVRIQLRRGNNSEFSGSLVLTAGEAALVEDEKVLIIGDGSSTYTQLKAAGKFINYQTEQGLGVVGGANATGETPLTVKGVGSQTAAILKVTNQGDESILEIFDDEGPTVRLEDRGDTNEVFLQLKQKSLQTGNALELKANGGADQMTISCDGEVAITPTNNQSATSPSLDVKGSAANQSNGILRVQKSNGDAIVRVKDGDLILGSVTDHSVPTTYANVRSQTNPGNTDSGAQSENESLPHFVLKSEGGANDNQRGKLQLNGNKEVDGSMNALVISKNGTSGGLAKIDYTGKGTFVDVRTAQSVGAVQNLADTSVLSFKDLKSYINGHGQIQRSAYNYNGSANTGYKIWSTSSTTAAFSSSNETSLIGATVERTTAGSAAAADPDLKFAPASNVFEILKVPDGEGIRFTSSVRMVVKGSTFAGSPVRSDVQYISYTSADLSTGKTVRHTSSGEAPLGAGINSQTTTVTHDTKSYVNNTGSDLYFVVAFRWQNTDQASSSNHLADSSLNTLNFTMRTEPGYVGTGITSLTS